MPHFDFTVTFGNLIELAGIACVLISLYYAGIARVRELELTLHQHASDLNRHADRIERFDRSMVEIVSQVQRILGRMDVGDIARELKRRN